MTLRSLLGKISRKVGVTKHPMQKVANEINKRGLSTKTMEAIELFAKDGAWSTDFMSKQVKSIALVEIDTSLEAILKEKYPNSEVYIEDSYQLLTTHPKKYDLILADAPFIKHGDNFQNFSLFPVVFNIFKEKSILIVNVIPDYSIINYSESFEEESSAYKKFYGVSQPQVSISKATEVYKKLGHDAGYKLQDSFDVNRGSAHYLVLFFSKSHD